MAMCRAGTEALSSEVFRDVRMESPLPISTGPVTQVQIDLRYSLPFYNPAYLKSFPF